MIKIHFDFKMSLRTLIFIKNWWSYKNNQYIYYFGSFLWFLPYHCQFLTNLFDLGLFLKGFIRGTKDQSFCGLKFPKVKDLDQKNDQTAVHFRLFEIFLWSWDWTSEHKCAYIVMGLRENQKSPRRYV